MVLKNLSCCENYSFMIFTTKAHSLTPSLESSYLHHYFSKIYLNIIIVQTNLSL
jgi:hypothetical protein